jgi:hypothetical protein
MILTRVMKEAQAYETLCVEDHQVRLHLFKYLISI